MEPGHLIAKDVVSADWDTFRSQDSPAVPPLEQGRTDGRTDHDDWPVAKRVSDLYPEGSPSERALVGQEAERLLQEVDRMLEAHKRPRLLIRVLPEPWWRRLLRRSVAIRRPPRSVALVEALDESSRPSFPRVR